MLPSYLIPRGHTVSQQQAWTSQRTNKKIYNFFKLLVMHQLPFSHDQTDKLRVKKIYPPSKAGCCVAFLKLAGAKRRRWLVLGEFAKYGFCGLKRKRRDFERSILKYVSIKIPALTHSGRKRRVCVNQPDRLTHPAKTLPLLLPFSPSFSAFLAFSDSLRPAIKSWSLCCLP